MIREAIRKKIEEEGISQKKIAQDLNLIEQNLSSFLKDKRSFPLAEVERILDYLKLEVRDKEE